MGLKDLFKKKEPLDIDASLGIDTSSDVGSGIGKDFSTPGMGMNPSMGSDFSQGFHDQMQPSMNLSSQQFQPMQSQGGDLQKDIQILSLKLDAIKAELDSMNQRIKNIEAI